jgi:hypothetical protein
MNIFDSEPCDDNIKKFRITCGEVYILMNIIDCSKKLYSLDLINSNKLDLKKINNIIPRLMISTKPLIKNETIADMFYFYLSSLNEKIDNYINANKDNDNKENDNKDNDNKLNLTVNDFCVISRNKCDEGLYNTSLQYKVYVYVTNKLNN